MEVDQPAGCEIQDQVKVIDPEEEGGGSQSAARSYECTFCKRGFTNAQALGGHMNIHRKEKAKLKQSASILSSLSSNKMPVDIPKIPTSASLPWVVPSAAAEGLGRGGGENATLMTMEETLVGEIQQLPLFNDQKLESHQVPPSEIIFDQHTILPFHHSSGGSELDLELRLGPEPQNSSSSSAPTGSTRQFF